VAHVIPADNPSYHFHFSLISFFTCVPCRVPSSIVDDSNDLQNIKEQSDDIDVQIQCSKDILLRVDRILLLTSHHQLGVHDQIQSEDESTDTSVHQPNGFSVEKYHEESETHEDDKSYKQTSAHHGEINLRLESEQGDGQCENGDNSHRHEHFVDFVVSRNDAQEVTLTQGEQTQRDQVLRSFSSRILTARNDDDDNNGGDPSCVEHTNMGPYVLINTFVQNEQADDSNGDKELTEEQ